MCAFYRKGRTRFKFAAQTDIVIELWATNFPGPKWKQMRGTQLKDGKSMVTAGKKIVGPSILSGAPSLQIQQRQWAFASAQVISLKGWWEKQDGRKKFKKKFQKNSVYAKFPVRDKVTQVLLNQCTTEVHSSIHAEDRWNRGGRTGLLIVLPRWLSKSDGGMCGMCGMYRRKVNWRNSDKTH